MHTINLLKIAAEAEYLRLKTMAVRQGMRAAFAVVALIFALSVLALLNVLGWQVVHLYVSEIATTAIILGINVLLTLGFGLLALRSRPSHTEREALHVRQQALIAARGSLIVASAVPAGRTLWRLARRAR